MKVGFVGLGTMGAPMAGRLIEAGFEVRVHNRTRAKEEPLAQAGATRAETPRDAARGADVVITMVGDTPDVDEVVLGPDGVRDGLEAGSVLVDMSTIDPERTRHIAAEVAARNATMVDAPCSGGSEGARNGTLSIMIGGPEDAIERARPVLEVLGSTLTRVGDVGAGQVCKAVNQVIIAGTYAAVAEGLALAMASGIDVEAAHSAVSGGAAGSWGLTHRGPNMIQGRYPLGFRTRLHRKDLGIALDTARRLGTPVPLAAWIEQLETGLIRRGYGDEDVSNIARVAREAAGLDDGGGA
ncbi:MAG: NAD(P)-dependent oxidoreductase [Trueperaceae bacterium]|nr:NAD(P)-dependent oxidoreductase [Trueperaceae bacterium]